MSSDQSPTTSDSKSDDKKSLKKLQAKLADAIIKHNSVDELCELLALGARVNEPVEKGKSIWIISISFS